MCILLQNIPCDEKETPKSSATSEETHSQKLDKITTTASHKEVEVEFIGADFCELLISIPLLPSINVPPLIECNLILLHYVTFLTVFY